MKIVFCSLISSLLIVGRLNKRLLVAYDSPGATDSYDAAVDSMGYGYLACFGVVFFSGRGESC